MMDIIELDHIILSFTADTHSYSPKDISAEAQQKQEGLMALKPACVKNCRRLFSISLSYPSPYLTARQHQVHQIVISST
ncbi:hypothetical protein [Klebsiella michiganensis]|uniref:hypothetical protein n=1 Tax=Klebsiella michiganensis TaxID=1134687 RepID=UPI0010574925|nr:hypothetical protein [Klebsiella michiganensis]QLX86898.1 hypothetical protein HV219_05960 [Klebsiella oxytoca]EKV4193841.1 hypothetical protein [Klebsiella michiganensis]ELO7624384.1 hypothetical protein [Klebsiella michiganensis]ELR9567591.1 hypothetical protein [Klebsiella michiganensis]KAB7493017.1 hypothetical protein F7Q97_00695 [Klebsiella michiganensis]